MYLFFMRHKKFVKFFFKPVEDSYMSFFDANSMMKEVSVLEKGIGVAVLRRKVLANNITNVDVPHFKRSEVSFESQLKRALEQEKSLAGESPLRTTNPLHIAKRTHISSSSIKPRINIDYNSAMRNDGNNVDIEDEVTKLVRNQLQYNLMIDRLSAHFRHMQRLLRPTV